MAGARPPSTSPSTPPSASALALARMRALSSSTVMSCASAYACAICLRPSSSDVPGSSLITMTCSETRSATGRGTATDGKGRARLLAMRAMMRASRSKSNSAMNCARHSLRSPIACGDQNEHADTSCAKSEAKSALTSGYCTLTTTRLPSSNLARCTCPIEAAPITDSSSSAKMSVIGFPRDSAMSRRTSSGGLGGTPDCSTASSFRYASGTKSNTETTCPNLM
mmetsp:Transcript_31584/g.73507  ORF Transcript_31584/g.73507 Transcript_31584/m.73507 type:complete len:224 (-) Transcript_31584:353-1024(-)